VRLTAGIEEPTDLTAQMTAAVVSASLALHYYGRISRSEANANLAIAARLYKVTMASEGVLKHYPSLWRSDSMYDDQLWAVRHPSFVPPCHSVGGACTRGSERTSVRPVLGTLRGPGTWQAQSSLLVAPFFRMWHPT
jgi:hypothetical protein